MEIGGLFIASLVLIVGASELFTNAVEWLGFRMRLASGATGSLLAALGTSLPEFTVPVVALLSRQPSADAVAMGAVLGAPFLLLSLGVGVTGVAVLGRRRSRVLTVDRGQARRDLGVFCGAFSVCLLCLVLPQPARLALGIALLLVYAWYVIATLRGGAPTETMPEPLHLVRFFTSRTPIAVIALQLIIAVALLIVGSELFVRALNDAATALHINPLTIAIVLVPVATELPETFNSVLWVRSNDDGLAFGNVAGSATFQACVLGFLGLCFTSWRPGSDGIISALITLVIGVYLLVLMRDGRARGWLLLLAALPWAGYVVFQLVHGPTG